MLDLLPLFKVVTFRLGPDLTMWKRGGTLQAASPAGAKALGRKEGQRSWHVLGRGKPSGAAHQPHLRK